VLHTQTVLTEFLLEDQGDGWWHCPSPLRCEVIDRPASYENRSARYWLVRTSPDIEWHGDPQYIELWGPDHPLGHPMDPTPFALVMAARIEPMRGDLGIFDGSVPATPVPRDPEPRAVAEARAIIGLGMKVTIRLVP
jgi:hypothetical protein